MSYGLLGTLLLLLPGGGSAEGTRVRQSPAQLWALPGGTVTLSCHISHHADHVNWYKEKPDGSLYWIYRSSSYSSPAGKYSGRGETPRGFSLALGPAQREDSGVYYCSSSTSSHLFGDGTRLIITDATQPQLSILVPIDAEEPGSIPLLCHLRDVPQGWDTVRWQPGGEVTPVTAMAVDEHGVLSAWSITWVSAERWDGAAVCTALENGTGRTLSVSISKGREEEGCPPWPLALGLPCVSLLLGLQLTILLRRRRLARGDPPPAPPSQPLRPSSLLASPSCPRP